MTNLRKTYEKVWFTKNLGWASDYQEILQKILWIIRTNLCKTYEKLTTTLPRYRYLTKPRILGRWCQSRNPLSEAVTGRILWAKNDTQSDDFLRMLWKKWLTILLRKSWEVVSRWLTKDLWKSYDELGKNLTKILRSFENRAREQHCRSFSVGLAYLIIKLVVLHK